VCVTSVDNRRGTCRIQNLINPDRSQYSIFEYSARVCLIFRDFLYYSINCPLVLLATYPRSLLRTCFELDFVLNAALLAHSNSLVN
jgi:hypothetical protein